MIPPPVTGGAWRMDRDETTTHGERGSGTAEAGRMERRAGSAGRGPHAAGLRQVVG